MQYLEAKTIKDELSSAATLASNQLRKYPRLPNGLTPDSVKFSAEYKKDKSAYDLAAYKSKVFNKFFMKNFKKRIYD